MTLTAEHSAEIRRQIDINHTFLPELSVRFETDQTVGYIPKSHLETYVSTGLFDYEENTGVLSFSDKLTDPELKSGAMKFAREALLANGIIEAKYVPRPQFRAVGGPDRLETENEEFVIDRNEYRYVGLPSDAIFLNVIIDNGRDEPRILLQKRTDNGKWDFAAGGAVKYPQNVADALATQIRDEIGVKVDDVISLGTANFKFSKAEKDWVTNQTHNLFQSTKPLARIGDFDVSEVEGFGQFTVEEAIELCGSGEFQDQNIQGFMTALFAAGLVPENMPARDELKAILLEHYTEPKVEIEQPQQAREAGMTGFTVQP